MFLLSFFDRFILGPWISNVLQMIIISPALSALFRFVIRLFLVITVAMLISLIVLFVHSLFRGTGDVLVGVKFLNQEFLQIVVLILLGIFLSRLIKKTKSETERLRNLRSFGVETPAVDWRIKFSFPFSVEGKVRSVSFAYMVNGYTYWTTPLLFGPSAVEHMDQPKVVYDPDDPQFGFNKYLLHHGFSKEVYESLISSRDGKKRR